MEKNFKRTLVTCALPYANGPVHIGHLAGVYVPADIYVRYLRMRGRDVLYVCGSDEHGVPITIKARQLGCSPQDIVDKYHALIRDSFAGLGINFDIYGRTTSAVHEKNASDFFLKLYNDGKFITRESEQYYDPEAGTFLADRYIVGTCPKCGAEGAYGDQCEKCGSTLSPEELINPKSKLSGAVPVKKKTTHWYLPLQDYEQWLREWILDGHKEWRSNVYGQVKSWLDGGLQPRAVTRDLDWGVPVPVKGAEGKVLYVWFDAPIGYISNTQELLPDSWETWWKSQDTKLVHFIGKDNIVFHCIVFPSMLKAYGDGYILPENVPANEFLNLEGDKISTSRNWAVWAHEYLRDFPGKEDVLRYVLTANAPETKDNDFSWKDFQQRNNSELVAVFGNFVNRAVVLTHKYFTGKVPPCGSLLDIDKEVLAQIPAQHPGHGFQHAVSGVTAIYVVGRLEVVHPQHRHTSREDAAAVFFLVIALIVRAGHRIAVQFSTILRKVVEQLFAFFGVQQHDPVQPALQLQHAGRAFHLRKKGRHLVQLLPAVLHPAVGSLFFQRLPGSISHCLPGLHLLCSEHAHRGEHLAQLLHFLFGLLPGH